MRRLVVRATPAHVSWLQRACSENAQRPKAQEDIPKTLFELLRPLHYRPSLRTKMSGLSALGFTLAVFRPVIVRLLVWI